MENKEPKIYVHIRTFAELIAIIGGILAIAHLFMVDTDMQNQIKELKTLAKESINQTKEFKRQNELLAEQNKILYSDIENQNSIRKNDIKPAFTLDVYELTDLIGGFDSKLINTGRSAKIIDIVPLKDNTFGIQIPRVYIGSGSNVWANFERSDEKVFFLHFKLINEDLDKNKYFQIFKSVTASDGKILLKISNPEHAK